MKSSVLEAEKRKTSVFQKWQKFMRMSGHWRKCKNKLLCFMQCTVKEDEIGDGSYSLEEWLAEEDEEEVALRDQGGEKTIREFRN